MNEGVYSLSVTKAVHLLESRANYEVLKTMVSEELAATIQTVYVYTARLLTNTSPKKVQIAHDTRDALNRIVANNGDLKAWSVGMAMMLDEKKEAGLLKTPQYNSMIVFNAIEDLKVITDGKRSLNYWVTINSITLIGCQHLTIKQIWDEVKPRPFCILILHLQQECVRLPQFSGKIESI